MIIKKNIVLFFLFMVHVNLICQETNFETLELRLSSLAKTVLNGETDSVKKEANQQLTNYLFETINQEKSYLYQFKEIEHISVLQPKNKKFKLFTWFVPYSNETFDYYGIIQICNKRGKKCVTYELEKDIILEQKDLYTQLNHNEWYGCLYYDVIPIKVNKKQYYTLLGWDGNDSKTTKKFIEVLTITKNKQPLFGANIFSNNQQRFIIEYSSQYPISLQYDEELEYIVFDHLEPIDGISINNFSIYATNLSYDVFKKTDFGWLLEENIYLNNRQ